MRALRQQRERFGNAGVRPRVIEQMPLINIQEPRQRVRGRANACGGERARDERRRAVADHATDLLLGKPTANVVSADPRSAAVATIPTWNGSKPISVRYAGKMMTANPSPNPRAARAV